ncbi:MAG: hypothetical protein NHG36_20020 [Chromatiaceae bacterium]|nr:hypothetical protein [Candidatus Thioaporhodococcus sediminis]
MSNMHHGESQFGLGADYVSLTKDGLRCAGTATAWDDLMIPGTSVKTTGNSPPELAGGFAGDNTLDLYVFDGINTTAGEPRLVLEFDAPVAGMLHVYRPDQVELLP